MVSVEEHTKEKFQELISTIWTQRVKIEKLWALVKKQQKIIMLFEDEKPAPDTSHLEASKETVERGS